MKIIKPKFEIITPIDGTTILKTLEEVGRTCYKSEDKITDDSCIKFVQGIIDRGHEAVIEHYNITVRLTNDRGVSHEEVRHRVASYAQESTRYCNYNKDKFGNEVTYIDLRGGMQFDPKVKNLDADTFEAIYQEWVTACADAERHYNRMIELGATPQIARSVLNNSTKTELCVTANLREWRNILKLRCSTAAHPQIRELMIPLLKAFKMMIPVVFDDIYEQVIGVSES
jgi:thymidylate synthase (FAD)